MATICLINAPQFIVDFQPFIDAKKRIAPSLITRVQSALLSPLALIAALSSTLVRAGFLTLRASGQSFKYTILGYNGYRYRVPSDLYILLFKIFLWAVHVFGCFAMTTVRLLIDKYDVDHTTGLTSYLKGQIDPAHLRSKETEIDVSSVPENVTVATLKILFCAIEFTDQEKPGYMPPTSRQEGSTYYTVEELKKSLDTLINRVENRTPFLGTPPSYDMPRLMAFYQQIENALRFSIHKVCQDLANFQAESGTDIDSYSPQELSIYKNLLENQARLAIDMAIAGKHCGARYMGEALSSYFSYQGGGGEQETLQDTLIEILAWKRQEIAQRHAYLYGGADVHALSKYMSVMGETLGIPGTRNVIEHLRQDFDSPLYLRYFFSEYTVDTIIDTVQEKIKTSQSLREQITDWLKDQVGDWNKKDDHDIERWVNQLQPLIQETHTATLPEEIEQFQRLIDFLRKEQIELPTEHHNLSELIDELFAISHVKTWVSDQKTDSRWCMQIKGKIKQQLINLDEDSSKKIYSALLENQSLPWEMLCIQEGNRKKIAQIRKLLPIQSDSLARVLLGQVPLKEAIANHLDLERRNAFLFNLQLEEMEEKGISSALIEWILVSQQILLPQELDQ